MANGNIVDVGNILDSAKAKEGNLASGKADADAKLIMTDEGTISVTGNIGVHGTALDNGSHADATANASAILLAPDITVSGPVTVKANAFGNGTSAHAVALLVAANSFNGTPGFENVVGDAEVHFGNAITVDASANGNNARVLHASAEALLAAESIAVDGNATVKALAVGSHANSVKADAALRARLNGFSSSTAVFHFRANGADLVDFDAGINVTANAQGKHASESIDAKAVASIGANSVDVAGPVVISALANGSSAERIRARGRVFIYGDATSISGAGAFKFSSFGAGKIHFANAINVTANAMGHDASSIIATGVVAMHAGSQNAVGSIEVDGPVTITAKALNTGATGDVNFIRSRARLIADARSSSFSNPASHSSNQSGDVNIDFKNAINVQALTKGGLIDHSANATAFAHLMGDSITVVGNIAVTANANGHGTVSSLANHVFATADLQVDGGHHSTHSVAANTGVDLHEFFGANVITLDGNVTVQGVAVGGDLANHVFASGFGRLLAEVVNVGGNVSVKGTAQELEWRGPGRDCLRRFRSRLSVRQSHFRPHPRDEVPLRRR